MNLGMPPEDWEVRKRDGCTCQYCGLSGLGNFDIWINLTIDHIIPSCSGGDDTEENKAVACGECNTLKGNYVPVGNEREERIADARRYVQEKRERWRHLFEKMMTESGALASAFPD
jgi:5-methylcytosine-specific restriction endonuclease McrA